MKLVKVLTKLISQEAKLRWSQQVTLCQQQVKFCFFFENLF